MTLHNAEVDSSIIGKPGAETIRIGLIADTHIPREVKILPPEIKEVFQNVDLILHAGDIYVPEVLDELKTIAPVVAARGNGDPEFPEHYQLNRNHVLSINGLNLLLTHAIYSPPPPSPPLNEIVEREFGKKFDIIVQGDSHIASIEKDHGILMVNPGSPTVPNGMFALGTVGLLQITKGRTEAQIIRLSKFSA
ncbi:MAG: metallophosphoesterase family protein [Dehalococcoidales bacterium]|nr:metallophosphoesterase family protein [Dehalococcoidales bacterium]